MVTSAISCFLMFVMMPDCNCVRVSSRKRSSKFVRSLLLLLLLAKVVGVVPDDEDVAEHKAAV